MLSTTVTYGKLKILAIDDNPADAEILRRLLIKIPSFDIDFLHCLDPESGQEVLRGRPIDCLFLDYQLGGRSGLDILRALRERGEDVPVIMLSDAGNEAVAVESMKHGAQDYMAKESLMKGAVTVKALERAVSNAVDKVSLARRLREKQQELESFVSVVAHDLKAPLTGVKNNVELLRDFYADKLDANGVQCIEASLRILGRSFALIESLLEYSRIGRSGRPLSPVDLNAVAESVLAGLRGAIDDCGGRVETETLPRVHGDETALGQLLQNLVANALKFRGPDPPVVRLAASGQNRRWVVSVADNGVGIHPKHAAEIFTPFKRLHSQKEVEGSGIGLATCKKIVEQHGGRIWLESVPGQGSTFRFTLAAAPKNETGPKRPGTTAQTPDTLPGSWVDARGEPEQELPGPSRRTKESLACISHHVARRSA